MESRLTAIVTRQACMTTDPSHLLAQLNGWISCVISNPEVDDYLSLSQERSIPSPYCDLRA